MGGFKARSRQRAGILIFSAEEIGPDAEPMNQRSEGVAGDDGLEATALELLRAAGGGDDGAFHALIDRHAAALFRVAMSMSRNRADAEDLMQETMVGAYRGLKTFAARSSVKTWLLQIMTRQAAKAWHRSRHRRATLSLHAPKDERSQQTRDDAALATRASSTAVERKIDVMQVLDAMSPAHREVLVLREIRGLSYEEMAQVLDVPRGTVESRLSRARAEFRERYAGNAGSTDVGL
jgi:RNA polymerase sigma-70 factor (ECF subfamily)